MTDSNKVISTPSERRVHLSRRNLFAAGAVLATVGSATMSRALADASARGCERSGNRAAGCNCFLKGTRLLTLTGELPVEALNIGDVLQVT